MIEYLKGDATSPVDKPTLVVHCCNDVGKFGSGFAGAIAKKWPHVQKAYFDWAATMKPGGDFYLGQIQVVKAETGIAVCNMIGQRDCGSGFHHIPCARLDSLNECLYRVGLWLSSVQPNMNDEIVVSCPRFACGLAGSTWDKIEPLIQDNLCNAGWKVKVYDL